MTINAIFFDLGGVLLRTENKTIRQNLAGEFNMTYEEIDEFVFNCPTAKLASVGKITEDEHWLDVTKRLELPEKEMPRIRDSFFSGDVLDQELLRFLRNSRGKLKTGLISNAWTGLRPWILREKFEDAFDFMTISAEVGWAKPDPRIYEFALDKLGVKAAESIFIDDVILNIQAANQLGMHGIWFRSALQTLADIQSFVGWDHSGQE